MLSSSESVDSNSVEIRILKLSTSFPYPVGFHPGELPTAFSRNESWPSGFAASCHVYFLWKNQHSSDLIQADAQPERLTRKQSQMRQMVRFAVLKIKMAIRQPEPVLVSRTKT